MRYRLYYCLLTGFLSVSFFNISLAQNSCQGGNCNTEVSFLKNDATFSDLRNKEIFAEKKKDDTPGEDFYLPIPLENPLELSALNDLSHFPSRILTKGERVFVFSPKMLRWAAYDKEGYLVAEGKANGGAAYCPDLGSPCRTPEGTFRIARVGEEDCVSTKFPLGEGGAPMPYCMFFGKGGTAIHGSPYVSDRNTSHGCIRVYLQAAKWLQNYFIRLGTKVVVLSYGSES